MRCSIVRLTWNFNGSFALLTNASRRRHSFIQCLRSQWAAPQRFLSGFAVNRAYPNGGENGRGARPLKRKSRWWRAAGGNFLSLRVIGVSSWTRPCRKVSKVCLSFLSSESHVCLGTLLVALNLSKLILGYPSSIDSLEIDLVSRTTLMWLNSCARIYGLSYLENRLIILRLTIG